MSIRIFVSAIGLLVVGATSVASAATVVQTQNFSFVPNDERTLTFNQYSEEGELESITVEIQFNKNGGSLAVDNDSVQSGEIDIEHIVQGSLGSTDVSLVDTIGQPIGSSLEAISGTTTEIGATTDDPTNEFNNTGLGDYYFWSAAAASDSDSGNIAPGFWSGYLGNGTFDVEVQGTQSSEASGTSALQRALVNADVDGYVRVTYTYTAIPEPASVLLMGLGTLAILARRKR